VSAPEVWPIPVPDGVNPWPDWVVEASQELRKELPSLWGWNDPAAKQAQVIAEVRALIRSEEKEARRKALEWTLRAESLADIRRRAP